MTAIPLKQADADPQMLAYWFQLYHPQVLRLCRYLLGSSADAEDAASEVFVKLPAALRTYNCEQPFDRWLLRVAKNYCIDLLRRRHSEDQVRRVAEPHVAEVATQSESPLDQMLAAEGRGAVEGALARLPERYRRPLVERYWEDLAYRDIAKKLGLTRANVATLLFRAKEGLRQILASELRPPIRRIAS